MITIAGFYLLEHIVNSNHVFSLISIKVPRDCDLAWDSNIPKRKKTEWKRSGP